MGLGRQWEERLRLWDNAFLPNLYQKAGIVRLEGFTTMEHICMDEAAKGAYQPFPEGTKWGRKWEYGWFRCHITLPAGTAGKRVVLFLGASPEMLVYVNGREAGSIDKQHAFVQLTPASEAGEQFVVYAECYAGHGPRPENGGIYPKEAVSVPEPPEFQCVVGESSFGVWNEEMFQAYADYHTLYELWRVLPESSLRAMRIAEALKEFTCQADFELPEPLRTESISHARQVLYPLLQASNGTSVPEFTVFGQSHLDLAWLWPEAETRRKAARTYANQIALMERYPEYRFLLCEPPILEYLKHDYPNLYERVKERAAEGRFIPDGAVWVEGDTNLAGGESLIRQFLYGKRWFVEEFGTDSRMAWLPDTFGFTGALPQIMKGCRVDFFATQKLLRCDPECEQFPYNLFWWEGIDGSKVLSHIYKKNNAVFSPAAMVQRWEEDRNQKEGISGVIFPFGYGDGGGGPTELMLEMLQRSGDLEGAPRARIEGPEEYFIRNSKEPMENTYYGELYLAWHRGTYTAQARIKKKVRQAEVALRQAEFLAGILRLSGALVKEGPRLEKLWKELLFCEFHDILPGTSIRRVNEEAEAVLDLIRQECSALAEEFLRKLAGEGAVFNSLSWIREWNGVRIPPCGYIQGIEEKEKCKAKEEGCKTGNECKTKEERNAKEDERSKFWKEERKAISTSESIEYLADSVILEVEETAEGPLPSVPSLPSTIETAQPVKIENRYYRAKVDALGQITSLQDKRSGYEYAKGALNELRMYRDVNVDYDAWELGRMYEQVPVELCGKGTREIRREQDKLFVEIHREERGFVWQQEIVFSANSPMIEFRTKVDWRERHKLLKAAFPTTVYTKEAIEEIQFGYLKRPTHRSRQYERDLYETCHHRYAVLSDGKNGLALLNDCKYGISAKDSTLALTLLRAPVIPDMGADQGTQEFTYALYLLEGPFTESDVVQKAYELNTPVVATGNGSLPEKVICTRPEKIGVTPPEKPGGGGKPKSASYFSVDKSNVIIETCKLAMEEENGVVLRLYECMGSAVFCKLSLPPAVKGVWQCNMLEEKQEEVLSEGGIITLRFHSFEIKTLLLMI